MSPLYRKIALRLLPFLMLLYMVAFLDRVNISFAALTMNRDLGISESLYGFAAGIFFLGYCLFEVPANLMLARVGARRWIAILMVLWGIASVGTAFVSSKPEYVGARFLLGVAESGFFPGVVFYLTMWLPRPLRARLMALFFVAIPISSCVGSPISSHILLMDHISGLKGWQWLFVIEGAPAIVLGAMSWFLLEDGPRTAVWLSAAERDQLARDLASDEDTSHTGSASAWLHVARNSAAYFMTSVGIYGLGFWLPRILVATGTTAAATGWWATLPYGAGVAAMLAVSRWRAGLWVRVMMLLSAAGFVAVGLSHRLPVTLLGFAMAAVGIFGAMPLFWSVATSRVSGKAMGAAIAIINSVGAVGAFTGPAAMGWLRDATRSYSAGLFGIAGCLVVGAVVVSSGTEPSQK